MSIYCPCQVAEFKCNILQRECYSNHLTLKQYLICCEAEVTDGLVVTAGVCHDLYCHDLEVMSSNPGQVELGVRGTSVLSGTWTKNLNKHNMLYKI